MPKVEALVVGDPLDDATDVSALIAPSERDRISGWVEEAVSGGAKVATGGDVRNDVLTPTVLVNVTPDMKVSSQEVFGPLIGVQGYDSLDEALALANDSRYGLQAAIFTQDLKTALQGRALARLRRRDRERDADLPHRPDAVRRREGQRQHQGGSALLGARDDRRALGRHPALSRRLDGRGGRNSLRATSTSGDRMGQLDGKVALVTGAASGIGRATAIRLASEGARICCVDIDPRGRAVAEEVDGIFVSADAGESSDVDRAFAACDSSSAGSTSRT